MMNKIYIFILAFLFSISLVAANFDYNESGNYNNYYQQGTGFFNEEMTSSDYNTRSQSIDDRRFMPLVSDLDNDGTNEIIIIDGGSIKLYHNKELTPVNTYVLKDEERYSNMIAYDIDGDNYTELIIALEGNTLPYDRVIEIIEYNGTDFYNQTRLNYTVYGMQTGVFAGEMMIKCRDVEECMVAFTNQQDDGAAAYLSVAFLNSTFTGHVERIDTAVASGIFCFPKIRSMAVADYDNDGDDEFIFNVIEADKSAMEESLNIYWIEMLDNHSMILENHYVEEIGNFVQGTDIRCYEIPTAPGYFIGDYITPPLLFDIDGFPNNGIETVIGYNVGLNEFNIGSFTGCSNDGCTVKSMDKYPAIYNADGVIISNVMLANVFPDSGNVDFCVMGYDDEPGDETIDLLCASEQATWTWLGITYDNVEFMFDAVNTYNLTRGYYEWNTLSHSVQHSTATTDGVNLNEFLSSYGIMEVDWDNSYGFQIPPIKRMNRIFESPYQDSVIISVDAEKSGREDLIALTSTNLWYIDDGYTNSPGYISYYYVNPCLDATWKINTSFEARVIVNNEDSGEDGVDKVQAMAILYYGDDNAQNTSWSANVTAGTTISFSGVNINKSIGVGTLRLMGRDAENLDDIDIIDLTFSAASVGVEFNDCNTEVYILSEGAEDEVEGGECDNDEECASDYACINHECTEIAGTAIRTGFDDIGTLAGLSPTTLWMIIMLVVTLGIWWQMAAMNMGGSPAMGVIAISNVLMIIIGYKLGMISIIMITIIGVIAAVIIAVFMGKYLTGSHSG